MSYILDALKKLEHEKAKKARAAGMSSITGELFSSDKPDSDTGGMWKEIVLITIVASLVTFGATWFFLKPGKQPEKPKVAVSTPVTPPIIPAPPSAQPPVQPPVQPLQPALVPQQAVEPPAVPPPPVVAQPTSQPPAAKSLPQKLPAAKPLPAKPAPTATSPPVTQQKQPRPAVAKPVTQNPEDTAALITIQELRKRMKEQRGQTAPTIAAPADIKLSGIAWQEERRARRAVINGFLMQEGSVVSGAKITEILPDRVRFSQSGGVFELSLTASSGMPQSGR